jgi:rRNA maturation endonuclease Nob1
MAIREKSAKELLQEKRAKERRGTGHLGLKKAEVLYPRLEGKKAVALEQAFLDMVEAREKWERLREQVTLAVVKYGLHDPDRPEQSILLIGDYKVENLGTRRERINYELAAAIIEKKLPGLAEQVLVKKVVLDVKAYHEACNAGKVPAKLREKIENVSVSYGLRWWPLHERKCPHCEATIANGGKFCPECGSKVKDGKDEED